MKVHRYLRNYLTDQSGQFAIMFALFATCLVMGAGMAIDVTRINAHSDKVQAATDAAVLAAVNLNGSNGEKKKIATEVFLQNLGISGKKAPKIKLKFNSKNHISVSTEIEHRHMLMAMFGKKSTKIKVESEAAKSAGQKTEIVLVLDYSSSMNGQYEEMRDGAIAMINELTDNGTKSDIKIGLVPFAEHVFFQMDGKFLDGGTGGKKLTICSSDRSWPFVVTDDSPTLKLESQWGVIKDNSGNDERKKKKKKGKEEEGSEEVIPSDYEQVCQPYEDNNLEVSPLTHNHKETISKLNAMTPHAGTNLALGTEFGWQLISPNAPWTEAASYADTSWRKVMVILGDGAHSIGGSGVGGEFSSSQGRENFDAVCDAVKDKGITVLTIAYDIYQSGARERLKRCASQEDYFFEGDKSNIGEVFGEVGNAMFATDLRIMR